MSAALIQFDAVSKWYGPVIGVNNITLEIGSGVTGLLGPNGAGKSTFLQLATGQLKPSMGSVKVLGLTPWNSASLNQQIGLCPEQDAFYEWMTGWDFVHTFAKLSGLSGSAAKDAASEAIEQVRMTPNAKRAIGGYSRGMRQRIKIAQAIAHRPKVLFLDEPFTGTDPIARRELMDFVHRFAGLGNSIILSSHVLHEVQGITEDIVLVNHGKLIAVGNLRDIRELIDKHPHRIVMISPHYRQLAKRLVDSDDVVGITFNDAKKIVLAETKSPQQFYNRLPSLLAGEIHLEELYSEDDNLDAVFKYLTEK